MRVPRHALRVQHTSFHRTTAGLVDIHQVNSVSIFRNSDSASLLLYDRISGAPGEGQDEGVKQGSTLLIPLPPLPVGEGVRVSSD